MVSCGQIFLAALLGQALVCSASSTTDNCINQYTAINASTFAVKVQEGVDWQEMQARCGRERPGYGLTTNYQDADRVLCDPGVPYPIGIVKEDGVVGDDTFSGPNTKPLQTDVPVELNADSDVTVQWGALRWTNNEPELHWVDNATKFLCAVCHMSDRLDIFKAVYPPHQDSTFVYDLKLVTYARIDEVGLLPGLMKQFLEYLAVGLNVPAANLRWRKVELNKDRHAVACFYYDHGVSTTDWPYYVNWNDANFKKTSFKSFYLASITKNNECTSRKLNLNNMKASTFPIGYVDSSSHLQTQEITTRECFWNPITEQAEWSPNITWTFDFRECNAQDAFSAIIRNGSRQLKTTDITAFFSVDMFSQSLQAKDAQGFHSRGSLMSIFDLVDKLLISHISGSEPKSVLDVLDNALPLQLSKAYTLYPKTFVAEEPFLNQNKYTILLIADNNSDNPVVGLALKLDENSPPDKPVKETIRQSDVTSSPLNTFHIVVTFSDSIVASANRVAIATIAPHLDDIDETAKYDPSISAWISLVQVSFARSEFNNQVEDDYVDIAFKPVFQQATLKGKCAERNFATDEWTDANCQNVPSAIEGMVTCRCKNIYQEGNLTSGMYILYGNDVSSSAMSFDHCTWSIIWATICLWALPKIISSNY